MAKEKEKVDTSDRGKLPPKSTPQSALLTDPKNRPVLVAKVRDDLNALRMAGFYIEYEELPLDKKMGDSVMSLSIKIVAPIPDKIGFSGASSITYNGKVLE